MKIKLFYIVVFVAFTGCKTDKISLNFLNEFIVKDSLMFKTINKESTNTLSIQSLKKQEYIPLIKELLFDFESVQGKLTDTIIDNIEGITFGPKLSNGNQSLILVADDNFQVYGKQLNQFILIEIERK